MKKLDLIYKEYISILNLMIEHMESNIDALTFMNNYDENRYGFEYVRYSDEYDNGCKIYHVYSFSDINDIIKTSSKIKKVIEEGARDE